MKLYNRFDFLKTDTTQKSHHHCQGVQKDNLSLQTAFTQVHFRLKHEVSLKRSMETQ